MGRDGISVVERAARVLDVFSQSGHASLTFNELLDGTKMSRATTHRVITDMVEHGFLQQPDHREKYKLGPLMMSTAVLAAKHATARNAATQQMERLRDQCGETVVLGELHGDSVVPVARVDGLHELRMSQEVGRRYPAYAGATGKLLLAYLPSDALDEYLSRVRLEPLTPRTVTSASELKRELEEIRMIGVAITAGERVPEALAMAAPIFSPAGRNEAALTISGVASRATAEQIVEDATLVRATADEISLALGATPPDPTARALGAPGSGVREMLVHCCERALGPAARAKAASV